MARRGRSYPFGAHVTPFDLTSTITPASQANVFVIQSAAIAQPAPTNGQVFVSLQAGTPPPIDHLNNFQLVATAVAQNVNGSQVITPPPVQILQTFQIQSAAPAQNVYPSQVITHGTLLTAQASIVTPATTVQAQPVPQAVLPSQVVGGLFPPAVDTTPSPDVIYGTARVQQVSTAQSFVALQPPVTAPAPPVPAQTVGQAIPQPTTAAQVTLGLQAGQQPPVTIDRTFVVQSQAVPQNVYSSQSWVALQAGNPPSQFAQGLPNVQAQAVGQQTYGSFVVPALDPSRVETVPVPALLRSVPYPQVTFPSQVVGGIVPAAPVFPPTIVQSSSPAQSLQIGRVVGGIFVTFPYIPAVKANRVEQPPTNVRVLGGITIGTPPPLIQPAKGLEGLTAPSNQTGRSSPAGVEGRTSPSELTGV